MDIVALGIRTAFGTGHAAIAASLAQKREAMARRADIIGTDFRPQLCIFARQSPLQPVADRVMSLIADALHDLAANLTARGESWPPNAALVLLTPAEDIGFSAQHAAALPNLAKAQLCAAGWLANSAPMTSVQGGAGSTATALKAVAAFLDAGSPVLFIAADSYACRERLNALLDANLLFSNDSKWGFVPGEAASAALITAETTRPPAARITGFAQAIEPVPERENRDSTHIGLSDAAVSALAIHQKSGFPAPKYVLTDWNNSRYRAAEFSYTLTRLTGLIDAKAEETAHPVHRFGQCGAAWFGTAIAALGAYERESALALSGNETDGDRSAFVIS